MNRQRTLAALIAAGMCFTSCSGGGGGGGAVAPSGDPGAPSNTAPNAKDDRVRLKEDASLTIDALANDSDLDGDTLEIIDATQPEHGTARLEGQTLLYVPEPDYFGADSFEYTLSDGRAGGTVTARIQITVSPVNDAPEAAPDTLTSREDRELFLTLALDNDRDVDGDALIVSTVTDPEHGRIDWRPGRRGEVPVYVPNPNFVGSEVLTYTAQDDSGARSNEAILRIEVEPTQLEFDLTQENGASPAGGITIDDVNFDGQSDVATVSWEFDRGGALPSTLETYMNDGRGRYQRTSTLLSAHRQRIAFSNLDGAGGPELVLFGFGADVSFAAPAAFPNLTGRGDASPRFDLRDPDEFSEKSQERQLVIADFNGDRLPDVALAIGSKIKIFIQRSGEYSSGQTIEAGGIVSDIAAADFDRDGNIDLAGALIATDGKTYGVSLIRNANQGAGFKFASPVTFNTRTETFHLAAGDFDADGQVDLATCGITSATVLVWLNRRQQTGAPGFASPKRVFDAASFRAWDLESGDIDGDGYDDLALARQATVDSGSVEILLSGSTESDPAAFRDATSLNSRASRILEPVDIALGDLDGDGRLDLVVADLMLNGFHRATNRTQ